MNHRKWIWGAALLAVLLLLGGLALADGGYDLSWHAIGGGGGHAQAGGYTLDATIGQPLAGKISGGNYSLYAGFWGGVAARYNVYLPLVLKGA